MNIYHGIATILYHQDPITGFEAYSIYPVDLPATLIQNDLGQWSIMFSFHFDHSELGDTIELGINHPKSSNPKIFIDHERWPTNLSDVPNTLNLTFFEKKADYEAPWGYHRWFTLDFKLSDQG